MNGFSADLISYTLLNTLLLLMLLGMVLAWTWALRRLWRGQPVLPERPIVPMRRVPWGAVTVFWVVVLYGFVNVEVSRAYAAATGRHALPVKQAVLVKPQPVDHARPDDDKPKLRGINELTQTDLLLQLAAINSLLLILVPALVRFTSGATLADFGLSLVDWRRQLAIGVTAALLMTPVVIAIQIAAVQIWRPHKHPVEEMVLDSFSPGIALLAVVSTMVLAPMIEELLFRAIVQRWLTQLVGSPGSSGSLSKDQVVAENVVGDLTAHIDVISTGTGEAKGTDQVSLLNPVGPEPRSYLAIVSTSLFFAAMHAAQWPAPIAIFVLAVALGTLYQRTGSLIAAIAMHGTFNGYSTLLLLHQALSRQIDPNHAAQQVEPVVGFLSYLISCI